jgi:hypothetical protein
MASAEVVYFNIGATLTQTRAGRNMVVSNSDLIAILNLSVSGVSYYC